MEEELKFGTSTNNLRPSEPDTTTNHGTSRVLVEHKICKSGQPTQDGTNSSNFKVSTSLIQPTTRSLKSRTQRMKKDTQLELPIELVVRLPTRDGRSSMLTKLRK
jgi:hypothetical protein